MRSDEKYFTDLIEEEALKRLPLFTTFCELLENCEKNFSEYPAISNMKETITYAQLCEAIAMRRDFLYSEGFKKGDHIAVLAPNSMYSMELYMAIPTAGCTVIMLPPAENALSHEDIEKLILDVTSWDLCDHLCKNLIMKVKGYDRFISEWIISSQTYKKRAAFTLIAASVIHNKSIENDTLDDYLRMIKDNSHEEHEHIKKAVSWALREIGKKDFEYNEKAILLAYELRDGGNKAQVWIGKDVIKELENTEKVEGRKRLISTKTQMGGEVVANGRDTVIE